MKRKVMYTIGFFGLIYLSQIAFSYSENLIESKYRLNGRPMPVSHAINNHASDHLQTAYFDHELAKFFKKHKINGASIAITDHGKLVYSKGFGYANVTLKEKVTPKHQFRIASVSKLITAVGIMKLHEDMGLNLDAKVFGPLGILNDSVFQEINDARIKSITIRHLLNHSAGWDRKKGDPLFEPLYIAHKLNIEAPVDVNQTIEYVLKFKKTDFKPGEKYSYCNFGYIVLGKVIEKLSGMSYEDYIQFNILHPLNIYDMTIGENYFEDKSVNEVTYYEENPGDLVYSFDGSSELVSKAYGGNNIKVLGAAGGWIATATSISKFLTAIDGFNDKSDILSKQSIETMTTPDTKTKSLLGWRGTDGYDTWWRTGTLAGSVAMVMRQRNNMSWVVLVNTTNDDRKRIHNAISQMMFKSISLVNNWPEQDLFQHQHFSLLAQSN